MPCVSAITMVKGDRKKYKITVPCGKCLYCLEKRRAEWTFRVEEELRRSTTAHFLTFTYNDEFVPYKGSNQSLCKRDLQLFLKRLRRDCEKGYFTINGQAKMLEKLPKSQKIKYYAVGEYGTNTIRPHYHMIIFNLPIGDLQGLLCQNWVSEGKNPASLGFVYVGNVETASIHYVTGYCINSKRNYPEGCEKPFSIISHGMGAGYIIDNLKKHEKSENPTTFKEDGKIVYLPRYYRDKIYGISKKQRIAEKASSEFIEKENRRFEECGKTGENYFESQLINYKQKKDNFNNRSKKSQL